MAYSDSLNEVAKAIHAIITAEQGSLGLKDVWYGEHDTIPKTPAITVEPVKKDVEVAQTGHKVRNDFQIRFMLFYSALTGPQMQVEDCLELAESVENLINDDFTVGGLLIYSYVTGLTNGYTRRSNVIMRATEIDWSGFSTTYKNT